MNKRIIPIYWQKNASSNICFGCNRSCTYCKDWNVYNKSIMQRQIHHSPLPMLFETIDYKKKKQLAKQRTRHTLTQFQKVYRSEPWRWNILIQMFLEDQNKDDSCVLVILSQNSNYKCKQVLLDLNIFLLYENSTNIRHKFLNLHRLSLFEVLLVGLISSLLLLICLKPCIMFV